jgi:hypothetical protein
MLHVHVAGRVLAWWLRSTVAFKASPTGVATGHSAVKQLGTHLQENLVLLMSKEAYPGYIA